MKYEVCRSNTIRVIALQRSVDMRRTDGQTDKVITIGLPHLWWRGPYKCLHYRDLCQMLASQQCWPIKGVAAVELVRQKFVQYGMMHHSRKFSRSLYMPSLSWYRWTWCWRPLITRPWGIKGENVSFLPSLSPAAKSFTPLQGVYIAR